MALDWYRTPEWSEEDELRLKRRLAAQRGYSGRAFALRVKASILEKTGDPKKREVAERLLRLVVEDPELELARTSHVIACEVSSAFDALGRMADRAGDPVWAEEYFRQGQRFSLTPGTSITMLCRIDADILKLSAAAIAKADQLQQPRPHPRQHLLPRHTGSFFLRPDISPPRTSRRAPP